MSTFHDASKVMLGSTGSNDRVVSAHLADPATFKAGYVVRLSTTGGLQLEDDSVAVRIGISLGGDLSDPEKRTAVCRAGNQVPIRLKNQDYATGTITFTAFADAVGDTVSIGGVDFVGQSGAATLGTATFRAATSEAATATSLAAQINAHATLTGVVTAEADGDDVIVTAVVAGETGNEIEFTYTAASAAGGSAAPSYDVLEGGEDDYEFAVIGGVVKVDPDTGEASSDGDATNAKYLTNELTGIYPDGTTCVVAIVDMVGGL